MIRVYTLPFKEYLDFKKNSSFTDDELLDEYIHIGNFALVALGNFDEQSSYQIANGIYQTVITEISLKRE